MCGCRVSNIPLQNVSPPPGLRKKVADLFLFLSPKGWIERVAVRWKDRSYVVACESQTNKAMGSFRSCNCCLQPHLIRLPQVGHCDNDGVRIRNQLRTIKAINPIVIGSLSSC